MALKYAVYTGRYSGKYCKYFSLSSPYRSTVVLYGGSQKPHVLKIITKSAAVGERSIAMSVSVCLSACPSVRSHISNTTRPNLTNCSVHVPSQ